MKIKLRWDRVEKTKDCWNWLGAKNSGYGRFYAKGKMHRVHRISYQELVGPIPKGLVIDHLCRNKACVNPAHLEAVTDKVNVLRSTALSALNAVKTHCKRGHEFTEENIYKVKTIYRGNKKIRTGRSCKICAKKAAMERYLRLKQGNI